MILVKLLLFSSLLVGIQCSWYPDPDSPIDYETYLFASAPSQLNPWEASTSQGSQPQQQESHPPQQQESHPPQQQQSHPPQQQQSHPPQQQESHPPQQQQSYQLQQLQQQWSQQDQWLRQQWSLHQQQSQQQQQSYPPTQQQQRSHPDQEERPRKRLRRPTASTSEIQRSTDMDVFMIMDSNRDGIVTKAEYDHLKAFAVTTQRCIFNDEPIRQRLDQAFSGGKQYITRDDIDGLTKDLVALEPSGGYTQRDIEELFGVPTSKSEEFLYYHRNRKRVTLSARMLRNKFNDITTTFW